MSFFQTYGILIIFGLLLLWMVFGRRGRGMGCGMGGNRDHQEHDNGSKDDDSTEHKHSGGCC